VIVIDQHHPRPSEPAPQAGGKTRGTLTIFFGMAPGIGKTRAMLQSARVEKLAGKDVVIATLEAHGSRALEAFAQGLPRIKPEPALAGSLNVPDVDLDALLKRRPNLVVVDELAHDNGPAARHRKRYHDVLELIEAGIDVYTTLNVQQVSSRKDVVERIIGFPIEETVPDSVLDFAEIELIDATPSEIAGRIRAGDLRLAPGLDLAQCGLVGEGALLALRELAVRLFAERINRDARAFLERAESGQQVQATQRLLAVVEPGRNAGLIVRSARNLAEAAGAPWMVLYVENSRFVGDRAQAEMTRHLASARELGAEVLTIADENLAAGILRVVQQRNVTQLVMARAAGQHRFRRPSGDAILRQLMRQNVGLAIHAVPVEPEPGTKRQARPSGPRRRLPRQYLTALAVVAAVTFAAFFFTPIIGVHATALVFLLMVVVLALFVERGPTLMAAALSAVLWEYFFVPPTFAFRIESFEDDMLFGMYFAVAFVLGHLTTRIRAQQEAERQREERSTALYLLTRELNEAVDLNQMVQGIVRQTGAAFKSGVTVLLPDGKNGFQRHPAGTFEMDGRDAAIPAWVAQYRRSAGRFTDNLQTAEALYVPLATSSGMVGVLGLRLEQTSPPTIHQQNLLDAFARQIALALDRHRLHELSEKTKLLAESERLSKTLIDSMSHEIRTPIAVIKGATGNLSEAAEFPLSEFQREMVSEIQEATARLNRLVGNMLEISRLESGAVKPRVNECDVGDLVHLALEDVEKELARHQVSVEIDSRLPVVRMDFVLMQQTLVNLLSNAALHTPPGTSIQVAAKIDGETLVLTVADDGPGIPPGSLPHIFDKFYRAPNAPTGGTGLGLSLVKGFVEAQGGRVTAENQTGRGAVFKILLPIPKPAVLSSPPTHEP
jgi:two-component system, OmpR family, sensor histidine kinase KdpD